MMIVTGAILFFLGASVSASPFLPTLPKELIISKHKHGEDKLTVIPSTDHSSIIENYIQEGTNVFFKPQFVLSSEQMPPQLQPLIAAIEKDDCKTYPLVTPVIVDEPLRVIEKEINGPLMTTIEHITEIKPAPMIPEPVMPVVFPPSPVLPLMEPPKVPVMVEEVPLGVEIPCAPMAPVFLEVEEPKVIEIPLTIPPGPVLPPIELPKLPVMIEGPATVVEPIESIVPFAPVMELEKKVVEVPVMIPPGPVLPPMAMPNLPVLVEETFVPEVHPVPEVSVAIPPGPVLPPVELPKLPVMVEHIPMVAELPCEHPVPVPMPVPAPVFVDVEVPKEHILVPPAPVLPPMEIPTAPIIIKEPIHVEKPIHVPSAHLLPGLEMPRLPFAEIHPHAYVEQNRFVLPVGMTYPDTKKVVHIPEIPQLVIPSIPDFTKTKDCVNDIIVERVLPKMEKGIYTIHPDVGVPRIVSLI